MTSLSLADYQKFDIQSQINTFKKDAQLCVDYIVRYRNAVERLPVTPDVQPGYLRKLMPRTIWIFHAEFVIVCF